IATKIEPVAQAPIATRHAGGYAMNRAYCRCDNSLLRRTDSSAAAARKCTPASQAWKITMPSGEHDRIHAHSEFLTRPDPPARDQMPSLLVFYQYVPKRLNRGVR